MLLCPVQGFDPVGPQPMTRENFPTTGRRFPFEQVLAMVRGLPPAGRDATAILVSHGNTDRPDR